MVTMTEKSTGRTTYFYCYNPRLRKFLGQNGLRWNRSDVHYHTGRTFWIFERNEELSRLIDLYSEEK